MTDPLPFNEQASTEREDDQPTREGEPPPVDLSTLPAALVPGAAGGGTLSGQLGRFRLIKVLGQGGMGVVYLAEDPDMGRKVALKVPHFRLDQPEVLARFKKEAKIAGRLNHPNICTVYDVGEINGQHFLTMEFVEGPVLRQLVPEYVQRSPADAVALVCKVAAALEEAHAAGVVHRDLKPANVMLDKRGEPKVMDFGLARFLDAEASNTRAGSPLGTAAYMPPEQARGELTAIGPHSDVYSLGVVLYELLTGQQPFQGPTLAVLHQVLNQPPQPPSKLRPDLDPRLEAVCLRALSKDPAQRYPSMSAFADALRKYPEQPASGVRSALHHSLAERVLGQLRTWGWEAGLERLRAAAADPRDAAARPTLEAMCAWIAGDRELDDAARKEYEQLPQWPALSAWAGAGQAIVTYRAGRFGRVEELLSAGGAADDAVLQGTLVHLRATCEFRQNELDAALRHLHEALRLFGPAHFNAGRVFDTLGMVYAAKDNFHAAREFFQQALALKERFKDEAGIALTHGQLGRLHLDWGYLPRAEEHFQFNLRYLQKMRHRHGEAQMINHLGQVALAAFEREQALGRAAAARAQRERAAGWLDRAVHVAAEARNPMREGYARKDRARLYLADKTKWADAEKELVRAEELFRMTRDGAGFPEGEAHVRCVMGCLCRARGELDKADELLNVTLAQFDSLGERAEAARTRLEIARTLRDSECPRHLATEAYLDALERAEKCRRPELVRLIEDELKAHDELAAWRHVFHRVRGRSAPEDTSSLDTGQSDIASILFLNLRGFSGFCQGLDSEEVMVTLNQLLADLAVVLERRRPAGITYLGGGFMAFFRDMGHAARAVDAALDILAVLDEFNKPRELLGLRQVPADVGVATGPVFIGNIGTYQQLHFTAVGSAVNLASRMMRQVDPTLNAPCISRETFEMVGPRYLYRPANPRSVDLDGLGRREVWDVLGRNPEHTSGSSRS